MKNFRKGSLVTILLLLAFLSNTTIGYGKATDTKSQELIIFKTRSISFNDNWHFLKDSMPNLQAPGEGDKRWSAVELPHDWSIEDLPNQIADSIVGPFSKASIGEYRVGYVVGGTAWYRKSFKLGTEAKNKTIHLLFDGVYMNSDVWLNGQHLGNHPYGYTPFYYDLTPYLKPTGEENILTVSVRNEGKNSRWYTGSGIYRDVKLIAMEKIHVSQWGVFITTPVVEKNLAKVQISTSIANELPNQNSIQLITSIVAPDGKTIAVAKKELNVKSGSAETETQLISVSNPELWSTENPMLYKTVTELRSADKIIDRVETPFGIRSISVDATNGLLLNGQKVLLKGGCIHHDNGPLGSATIGRAEERKIELLKNNGFNAIRLSHNPPSQKLLDACDRLGMLVVDEAFDMWEQGKNPEDYHLYFKEWWCKDITNMILRDRNHPSIIIWSFANEIAERSDSNGIANAKNMIGAIKSLDTSRPVTQAICPARGLEWDDSSTAFGLLDIGGYNYQMGNYETDHEKYPNRIMMGTESFPKFSLENWNEVEKLPYVIGDFVWTAIDYMGEASLGNSVMNKMPVFKSSLGWPWFNAWCGDLDIIGNKKPQSYYRDIVWRRSPIALATHLPVHGMKERISKWGWRDELQSWTWPGAEGKPMEVKIYSRATRVRLKLNDKIIGEQQLAEGIITATFSVPYEPGVLKAFNIKDGMETDSVVLSTTGAPKHIRLSADRNLIKNNRDDLSYVMVDMTDDQGQIVPTCNVPISFSVAGAGEIVAVGNANPTDMSSFKEDRKDTFRGRCLVIIRPKGASGKIILKAKAEGLVESSIEIRTK